MTRLIWFKRKHDLGATPVNKQVFQYFLISPDIHAFTIACTIKSPEFFKPINTKIEQLDHSI